MKIDDAGRRCRIGFVGCGRATTELHLPALRRVPAIEVVAVCDVDERRAGDAAARAGGASPHTDVRALLETPGLDAVAVCTPPDAHADAAVAVLESGRHLFLEKPLALSLADCDRIIERAASAPGKAVVGLNLRQHRLLREARGRIRAGELGGIELIRGSFTTDIALRARLPEWRLARRSGGGVLHELAVHHFDLWRWLLDVEFEHVYAESRSTGSEDATAVVTARTATGILATAQFSERTHAGNELEVLGDGGRMRVSIYDFDGLEAVPTPTPPGGLGGKVRSLRRSLAALPAGIRAARLGGDYIATFAEEWRRFADTVLLDAPPAATLEDGRAATRMSLACVESARTGRPVRVRE